MNDQAASPSAAKGFAAALQGAAESRSQAMATHLGQTLIDLGVGLRDADPKILAEDAASYARRSPLSFLTLAATIGFAAVRLMPEAVSEEEMSEGLDDG